MSSEQDLAPEVLTVVFADRTDTYVSVVHEQEWRPWKRRTVQIELTPEQREKLQPRHTGYLSGEEQHESIVGVWLEEARSEQ